MKIILATTSKFKIKTFQLLNIPFLTVDSKVDEKQLPRDNAKKLVQQLSYLKAYSVSTNYPNDIIIGLDSVACFNGKILEKPLSKQEAIVRLQTLSGNQHTTLTGICIICPKKKPIQKIITTKIFMRNISSKEIIDYVNSDKDIFNICLGYDPEGLISGSFVKSINGSYHNFLSGMPIETIIKMLYPLINSKND